jgi:hypothetical protein
MTLKKAYKKEIQRGKKLFIENNLDNAFYHFENAHVLGQKSTFLHTASHYWMLRIGIRRLSLKEIIGQVFRIFASLAKTWFWVPVGNTGGTNVSPIKPMPIRDELKKYF